MKIDTTVAILQVSQLSATSAEVAGAQTSFPRVIGSRSDRVSDAQSHAVGSRFAQVFAEVLDVDASEQPAHCSDELLSSLASRLDPATEIDLDLNADPMAGAAALLSLLGLLQHQPQCVSPAESIPPQCGTGQDGQADSPIQIVTEVKASSVTDPFASLSLPSPIDSRSTDVSAEPVPSSLGIPEGSFAVTSNDPMPPAVSQHPNELRTTLASNAKSLVADASSASGGPSPTIGLTSEQPSTAMAETAAMAEPLVDGQAAPKPRSDDGVSSIQRVASESIPDGSPVDPTGDAVDRHSLGNRLVDEVAAVVAQARQASSDVRSAVAELRRGAIDVIESGSGVIAHEIDRIGHAFAEGSFGLPPGFRDMAVWAVPPDRMDLTGDAEWNEFQSEPGAATNPMSTRETTVLGQGSGVFVDQRDSTPSLTPRSFSERVDAIVMQHLQSPESAEQTSMVLRLDPPELGRVQVHLSMIDDVVSIRMVASSEGARQVIERQLNDLQQSLTDHGVAFADFQVDCRSSGHQSSDREMGKWTEPESDSVPSAGRRGLAAKAEIVRMASRSQLDYVA
jgi:hypothetical protein